MPDRPKLRDVSDPNNATRPMAELRKLAAACGLDPKRAAEHGLTAMSPSEVDALVGRKHAGIGFTYHQPDGTPIGVARVRMIEPLPDKCPRYLQPTGSVPHLYLPQGHGFSWDVQEGPLLMITEGEKKAHAGCAAGIPTVGIGGVWMGAKKKAGGSKLLIPVLRTLVQRHKMVFVAFDSDKDTNEQVLKAEAELLALLRGMNVEARTVAIPPAEDGSKQGLDDYLLAEGKQKIRARMRALLEGSTVSADMNDDWVAERNEHWCYVENPGNEPYVLIDNDTRMRLATFDRTFVAKRAAFDVLGKLVKVGEAELWRSHAKMRRVSREVFHTTHDPVPEGVLNRYVPPTKPEGYRALSLEPLHAFVRAIVSDEEQRWLYTWVAHAVQTGLRPEWNVFCWSNLQGAGKTFLGKLLGACFSPYSSHITTADLVRQTFGSKHFEHVRYLLVDEGESNEASGRRLEEMLKHASSAGHLTVEEKYQPARVIENRALVYLASNHQMTRHISRDDRRTYLLHLTNAASPKLARAVDAWLHVRPGDRTSPYRPEAVWALWQYFSRYKLHPDFDVVRAPTNAAKQHAIDAGRSQYERLVAQLVEEGVFCEHQMPEVVSTKLLATLALEGRVNIARAEYVGEGIRFGRLLAAHGCEQRVVKNGLVAERFWAVRNIAAWRKRGASAWLAEAAKLPVTETVTEAPKNFL